MAKVGLSLKKVSTNVRSCRKPGCGTGSYRISRHHKAHEFMFVSAFVRTKYNERTYREFVNRYYEFRPEDTVRVCDSHHTEVHIIYDHIIQDDLKRTGKKLQYYSWREAQHLMELLRVACEEWLLLKTPGCNPKKKRRTKGGYQAAVTDLKRQWGKK